MFELNKDDYLLGMWFMEKHDFGNVKFLVKKGKEPKSWEIMVIYRYFSEESKDMSKRKVFNSGDEKSAWKFGVSGCDEEQALKEMRKIFKDIQNMKGAPEILHQTFKNPDVSEELLIQGDIYKFLEVGKNVPWMHVKAEQK